MNARVPPSEPIAIIGLAGRFPGADDVAQYWKNIKAGVTSITRFAPQELEDAFSPQIRASAEFVAARPILNGVDLFDTDFFSMHPREAALTDPQHRLLLECAWQAFEDASIDPASTRARIGVFAGSSMNTYFMRHVSPDRASLERFSSDYQIGSYQELLGALPDTLATRLAYKLNLRGPAMTVQSACSTSLLAVMQACQSLTCRQSDMALAGGVSITFPQQRGYLHQEGGMASRDGVCRPFDAAASGTVFGDGVALVVLKRLADAIADDDYIYAVIKGGAVNNDGADKAGFTAPSIAGQVAVISAAHAAADVDPRTIGYVECHGTATPLGDPIEFAALARAFGASVDPPRCALGSVKANIGHLDVASGVAGLIKAALALHNRTIPLLANYAAPNPRMRLDGSPFYIPKQTEPWKEGASPRRAGVSSLGVGGTNVHIVLEEAPMRVRAEEPADGVSVLPISAKTDEALACAGARLAQFIEADPSLALEDVAATLQSGRAAFDRRAVVVAASRADAVSKLSKLTASSASPAPARLVFMFPGQGAQKAAMCARLYATHPEARELIDEGVALMAPIVGAELRHALIDAAAEPLDDTRLAQPALFLAEYVSARILMHAGLKPDAMVGHSVGEFAAASIAGVFDFAEACRFIARRACVMAKLPKGAMLAVRLPEAELRALAGLDLDIAAINAPSLTVVSGEPQAIERLRGDLAAKGVASRLLATSHAFHSRAVDEIATELAEAAEQMKLCAPQLAFASCVTGDWVTPSQAASSLYWTDHARAPVRFCDALQTAIGQDQAFLLEIGPGKTLSALAAQIAPRGSVSLAATDLAGDQGLESALGALWRAGYQFDWRKAIAGQGLRTPLPTYPFQRKRCWIERPPAASEAPSAFQLPASASTAATAKITMPVTPTTSASRIETFERRIVDLLQDFSGAEIDEYANASFLELGFDSLLLGQFARAIEKHFKVKLSFGQLMSEIASVEELARYLDEHAPQDAPAGAPSSVPAGAPVTDGGAVVASGAIQADALTAIVQSQLQAMHALFAEQLRAAQSNASTTAPKATSPPATHVSTEAPRQTPASEATAKGARRSRLEKPGQAQGLNDRQRQFVAGLIERINARTPKSKAKTQRDRDKLADPRTVAGFRGEWKELVYPLIAERAEGSRIWDIDGNEYIDLVNGYGQTAFGHSPPFVREALAAQLASGFPIGPQSPLAGEVADLIAEMTGVERVTFCNTGSEAVMAAMRVARAVTGRERIVVFANDYHGQFDEVLVHPATNARAAPIAPGIPNESLVNMAVLPYGEAQSLDWIKQHGSDIAAVIVEPVQSRHPSLRPEAFVRTLREITSASGAALVFDEIVTGFRVHPGGMQHMFGVKADLVTYGKVLGGGMPIGVLAGARHFMDALDGGSWRYGDASFPEVAPTFFAGTFVRHPLTLAAAKAVLLHMKERGPQLQQDLSDHMGALSGAINDDLGRRGLATRAEHYSSWFFIHFAPENPLASLFFPCARLHGLHVQEHYPCFLTTAHTGEDIAAIERVFATVLDELEDGEILRAAAPLRTRGAHSAGREAAAAALTEPQIEILTAAQLGAEASCAFNESVSVTFEGEVDAKILEAAINAVVDRHQALRGRLDGETMRFAPTLSVAAPVLDVSRTPNPEADLRDFIAKDAATPFDLTNGPLVRAAIIRLSPSRHVLVLTAHHIVCDGWSFNLVLEDLARHYRGLGQREPPALEPAPMFSAYAQSISLEASKHDLAYWTKLYATLPPVAELPADRRRGPMRGHAGATYSARFDAALTGGLKKTGARSKATLFSMLLTGLQVVLARLTGETDIVIGAPFAGQSIGDNASLVGHCVNMLPLRGRLDWQHTLHEQLQANARHVLEAFAHPNSTYGAIVRSLALARTTDRLPLTQVQFNLERLGDALDFGGLGASVAPNPKAAVNFELFINVIETNEGLRVDCDYNRELFEVETIARWIDLYRHTLEAMCSPQTNMLRDLKSLPDDQQRFQVETVNETATSHRLDQCVHEHFAEQARLHPRRTACTDAYGDISYAELDLQSTRLAQKLSQPSGTRGRVAIAVDRSRSLLVSLLAVMKAGHAYVPLDQRQPEARLRQIIKDAKVVALLCQDDKTAALAPAISVRVDHIEDQQHEAPLATPARESAAYVLYTSGSTGEPKGVEIAHRSLTNTLSAVIELCALHHDDRFIASSAITFDIAATELLAPLMIGARVIIADAEQVQSGFDLVRLINTMDASVAQATPTLWRMLLEAGFASRSGFKMITAGEPMPRDVANRLLAGGGRLWNLYGPTETTIYSSGVELTNTDDRISIGKPIANTQLFVLDADQTLAPLGARGMLYIGGDGLALGYLGQPALTQQAFRQIAMVGGPSRRLYRTGDIARLLANGEFELLGRDDQQVKLRGFRIELEEIETTLQKTPGVTQCAVLLRNDLGPEPVLVCYYAANAGVSQDDLAAFVTQRLPSYMTPKVWQPLEALPLTASGKLDRRALVRPHLGGQPATQTKRMPKTTLETKIADAWASVLGRTHVDAETPIFELGADLLQIFRIAARLHQEGIALDARGLMKNPSVERAATDLERLGSSLTAAPKLGPSLSDFKHGRRRHGAPP